MTHAPHLAPVPDDGLPVYPIGPNDRLDSHYFMPWERRRWLNSDMRLKGDPVARALYFDLICISYEQSPIGTLPDDRELLAKLSFTDPGTFSRMCDYPFGPLHRWQRCEIEGTGEIRLFHPMVLHTLMDAIARKEHHRAEAEAGNRRQRLSRLRGALAGLSKSLAENSYAVTWIDGWLEEQGCRYRNAEWLQKAAQAFNSHMLERNFKGSNEGR